MEIRLSLCLAFLLVAVISHSSAAKRRLVDKGLPQEDAALEGLQQGGPTT